ncbi:protein TASOR 2-like isoform X4 [Salvelinus alpinus]|uniref:protein TASOR 2-like isoform X4 n=1 Tax=Salvelinus alpinus TaxID=8036 RepID=UPI0039FBE096
MEIDNGAVREGVLVPVLPGSKNFDNSIRPPLQNSYMYKESKQSFRYNSAFLINNATLQERYEAFRTKRRDMGYSEEEMEESYGFLLFDDENKANKVGETGVVPGHSTCTTLGDPSKGVYVSKYSDCLDLNRWYHGKSGYIAIIKLTKGRVREVTENYTVNYTSPSNEFDCHVSEQLSSVSANTSSFLAFERTQYYMYELPVGGAVQPPSHVCPFAIVAFSYWDTKTSASEEQEKSEEEKTVFHYYPWRGQLQISSQIYHVGLKSSTGPLIPAKLPTMMSVDGAIQMSDLRQKLPKAIFETCFSGEVSLEGMGCSLYELAPSEAEDTSLSQLTQDLKEKDLALTIQLNDNGFLILLHSSHFLTYEDTGSSKPEVLQGMFVFPDSRAIHRDTKVCWKKPSLSPECLQVVPALNYAETEVEKCLPSPSGELRGLLEQHIQSYASLIHPGLTISPSREASIFPDQFDVPDALKYLYSAPKWTEMGWKRLRSYFHQPGSFELSVSRATELLVAGREERGDEPDDDVYYCLSSPEGSPMSPASLGGPEEQQSGGKAPGDTADTAADFSKALVVSMEDFEKPGKTMEDSNASDKAVKEGNNLLSKEVQERLPSDLSKPLIPADDFGKPGLNKAHSNAPGITLPPKEVQEELPSDLFQPSVSADDSEKPGKTKADCNAPGVRTEDEGTSLIPEEVEVDVQEKVHSDLLQPAVSAEDLGKADLAALGKADCNAPEVGVANEETNLYLKEVQKDMPSGVSQPPVSAEVLRKPSPALATKPNSKAPEAGVEDNVRTLPQKEVQEEVPSDLSQLAVSAKAFGIASMRVMKKATEVTEVSTSPASGNLPTVLVITATERTETVLPHNENLDLINTESTTNNSSSLPCAKVQDKGGSALNGQRGKANQPSKPTEVSHSSISDWRKRPRKRHRFSGLGKRILRSTVADFEAKEKEDMESMDSSEVYLLKKRKERMDLIQVNPLQKEERMDVTQVHPLKMPRELMNLIQDPPLKKKEKVDVTQVHPLKMPRELRNLIQDPPLKMKSKDLIHYHPLRNKESMDLIHDDHPLKKKTERWDLKAIISECGRIFVPHGSEVIAKDIESLKIKGKVLDHKQCADEMMVEACIKVPQPIETGDGPNLELNKSDENKDLPIDSKDSLHEVKMADVGKMASLNPSELVLNKDTDSPSSGKHKKKRQYVAISLSQLKTVLSRGGKRNTSINPAPEDQTSPLNKKSKADTPGMDKMENDNINKANPDRTTGAVEVAKEQTFGLDPKFALALGLTPTELHNDAHKSPEKSDIPLKKDIQDRLDLVPPQATSDQTSEALPSSPSTTIISASERRPFKKKHEHADSIRKKCSILQVPISEGLQQHRKDIFADGSQTLRAFLCQQKDQNRKEPGLSPESLSKGIGCKQKFHRFRRFIEKDGSVQVTRLWKENYNFNSDSKFTNDPKDKTVIRALHGPWDFDIKDTKEQVQLIIHMWIGLFYSRSTARFCQADSTLTCLEKMDSTEVGHGTVPAQVPPETKTSSPAYIALSRIPEPEVLDLSSMGKKEAQPLSLEAEVLDLSMKTTSTVLVSLDTESKQIIDCKNQPLYRKATGLHKETISCPKRSTGVELKVYRDRVDSMMSEKSSDLGDDEDYETNNHENDSKGTLQNGVSPYERTLESDRSYILLCEQAASVYIHQEKLLETETAQVLEGNNKKLIQKEEEMTGDGEPNAACLKTMGSKDVNKEQQLKDNDSVKTMPYTEVQMDGDAVNMADTVESNANEARDGAHVVICDGSESKEEMHKVDHNVKDSVEAAKPEAVHTGKDTTNKEITKAQTAVHVGKDFIDKDKALKAVHSENVPRDYGNTKDQVQTAMQDGNDTRDETLPAMICGEDSGDKAPPVVCDGNTSVAEALPEISHTDIDSQKATLSVVHGGNDPRDTTLPVKCNGKLYIDVEPTVVHDINGSTDEELPMGQVGDVSAGTSRVLPEMHGEIKCKDDELPTQVFTVCDGNMPFVGEFDTLIQPNNVLGVAKHEIDEADVETKQQEKELMQGQSKSDDVTTQSSTTFPPGSQHSQDETSERLTGQVEIPPIPREDIAHTDVLHSIGEASEMAQGQVEIPFIGVEIPFIGVEKDSQDINHTEVHDTHPSQKETLITVCDSANVLSAEMLAKIVSKGTESVSRCPTVDEVLYGYIPIPDICSASLAICDADGVSKPLSTGEGYSRCPTPTEYEPPFVPGFSYVHHTPNTVLLPNAKDTNSPNLDSGLALIENEKDHHEPSLSLYKARAATGLHKLHKYSNNNKPNNLEAIDNQFSQILADPRKNPIATSTPLNTPSSSLKERSDYDPYSNMRLAAVEPDLHAHSSRHLLHSFSYSFPNTHCSLTEKAAFSVPSIHPEVLSNETTVTGNFSEIALERETCLRPALSELILQSTRLSIPAGSGPTAASQNLSVHSFTQPQPNSQQPAMIVNLSKSEDSRGQYNWEEGQTDIDPMSSDVLKSKQTDTPVRSNTNAHPYNTEYAREMRQIAVLQDYEDVMADEDVMGENEAPSVDKDKIESSLETNWISDDKHLRSKFRLNKTRLDFINSLRQSQEWEQREFDGVLDFSKQGISSSVTFQSEESDKILSRMEENQQEWLKYCRATGSGSQMDRTKEEDSSVAKPRLVTVLDHKGNRITYENYPVLKPTASMHTRTVPDSNRQGLSSFLEFSKRWDDTHNADESDLTQSSMDLETLIFSERMNQMLKRKSSSSSRYIRSRHRRSNVEERASTSSPAVTVHFSSLQEDQDGSEEHWEAIPSLAGQKIRVEMPERMAMPEETDGEPQHLKKLSCTKGSEMTHVKVSDLVVDSFKAYHAMMTEVCAGKKYPSRTERLKREEAKRNSSPKSRAPSKDFCGQMKEDMYDSLHDNLNSVVRQSCKNKFRFYILVTSSDPFFRETKELLEAEGHIAVEQSQFCLGKESPSCPLHIILRNEDIAEHICEVPHLLELKKSQNVLFAGIDRPDDIVNLTHQELFGKGGFVVFEGAALHTLSLSNMKKMSGFLEGLSKKGKWKWLLHYRDSRKLKENARSSVEAQGKKIFMDVCQEAGMVEVLPYHECDVISRERPNYLHCLVRLQVQNVSARLPVFITDTTADKAFAKHGIFTMNINSFLLISQSDTCTIS